jgi:hypothetical protein
MALNLLALPVDIPWQLVATSEDMYSSISDPAFPAKWRSSVGVYTYEPVPEPDEPTDPNEITTYVKVVATVTGYQPDGAELDSNVLRGVYGTKVIENFEEVTSKYFPAYSALLQVAVYPQGPGEWSKLEYPYFADFEPKKRELIELVTETGESLTQSGTDVNVRKGTTSIDKTEQMNIDKGGSFGMQVNTPYGGGGFSESHQQEVGTRGTLGTEAVNVISTDSSREKRESYSHQTNLSQLYHLLDGYHAATNRAVFFLNARPHQKDSPYTFVNGPRYLEGVQEFFLVVRRPKAMEGFCVKAILETAHLRESETQQTTGETTYDQEQLTQSFTLHADGGTFSADDKVGEWTMNVPGGYVLDRTRGGGTYSGWGGTVAIPAGVEWTFSATTEEGHESEALPQITPYDDHVDIRAHIYGTQNLGGGTDGNATYTVTIYTRSVEPTSTPQTTTLHHVDLFLTAREVTSCPNMEIWRNYVSFETALSDAVVAHLQAARAAGPDAVIAANAVGRAVRDQTALSVTSPKRYPPGAVDFLTSNTFLDRLRTVAGGAPDPRLSLPLAEVAPQALRGKLGRLKKVTVGDALASTPLQLAATLGVQPALARELLANAAGVAPGAGAPGAAGGKPAAGGGAAAARKASSGGGSAANAGAGGAAGAASRGGAGGRAAPPGGGARRTTPRRSS